MNPLSQPSDHFLNAPAFDLIKTEHFLPAIEAGLVEAKANVAAICDSAEAPTFANTIVALEHSATSLDHAARAFSMLSAAHGDQEMQQLAKTLSPMLSAYANDLYLNATLFTRVDAVYAQHETLTLSAEQQTLLEQTYQKFVRNGAKLNAKQQTRLRTIDADIAKAQADFNENALAATNAFELVIENEADLAGLPQSVIDAAALAAKQRELKEKWVFTLHAPSYTPVMKFLDNRELRQAMWTAMGQRANGGKHCNQDNIRTIAHLRAERAQLLGYATYAEYELEQRMAGTPEAVHEFLDHLHRNTLPQAETELAELKAFRAELEGDDEIQNWDRLYYSEKLRQAKYAFDSEQLRPYFELSRCIQGSFEHARKLFNLSFTERHDLPVYHEDVQVFSVQDNANGDTLGLLYLDFFPRDTKRAGAWCGRYRDQGIINGQSMRPHVSVVCNFTPPTEGQPALLSFDEVTTLFHEFGHALHGLLSQCTYPSLSCTLVRRDFVELPSQVLENWVQEADGLALFAQHYETGEALPSALLDKLQAAANFNAATDMLRQLSFGKLDMAWHETTENVTDVIAFERAAMASCELLPVEDSRLMSTSFSHIFVGGYAAGYYSYKWAEVLDADAYELFKEKGIFDQATAQAFRLHILEKGGSEDPMKLYEAFRGQKPDPDALLRRVKLI